MKIEQMHFVKQKKYITLSSMTVLSISLLDKLQTPVWHVLFSCSLLISYMF